MKREILNEEQLELEFANSPAWEKFGKILSEAHETVYEPCAVEVDSILAVPSASKRSLGRFQILAGSAAVLAAVLLTVWSFRQTEIQGPADTVEEFCQLGELDADLSSESDDSFCWNEEEESELARFDDFLNLVAANDDSDLDWEITILDDSLGELAQETEESTF